MKKFECNIYISFFAHGTLILSLVTFLFRSAVLQVAILLHVQGLLEKIANKFINGKITVYFVGWRMFY